MIVDLLKEMRIISILHRGVPNRECIAILVNEDLNLGQYGVMLGTHSSETGGALPFNDNLFWFGDGKLEKGDWIFIYTGSGVPTKNEDTETDTYNYSIFWGRLNTVFANTAIVPLLFRSDAVDVLQPPLDVPQSLITDQNTNVTD